MWQKAPSVQPNSQWDPGGHFSPFRSWFLQNTLSTHVLSCCAPWPSCQWLLIAASATLCLKAPSGCRRMQHPRVGQVRSARSAGAALYKRQEWGIKSPRPIPFTRTTLQVCVTGALATHRILCSSSTPCSLLSFPLLRPHWCFLRSSPK